MRGESPFLSLPIGGIMTQGYKFKIGDEVYFTKEYIDHRSSLLEKRKTVNLWDREGAQCKGEALVVLQAQRDWSKVGHPSFSSNWAFLNSDLQSTNPYEFQEPSSECLGACQCNLLLGCSCGKFQEEMRAVGKVYNKVTKEWA